MKRKFIILFLGSLFLLIIIFTLIKFCNYYISMRTVVNDNIFISRFTGERINTTNKKPVEITFINDKDSSRQSYIANADIVFEYLNNNNRTIYKAIFHDNYPKNVFSESNINEKTTEYIPDLNFIDNLEISKLYVKSAASIFITFNDFTSSNFIYINNQYTHYKDTILDLDKSLNIPVTVSNIVVQFIDEPRPDKNLNELNSHGTGLVFSGGKVLQIKWNKEEDKPIKIEDDNNNEISIARGHTWWVLINKNASVAYN